MVIYVHSEDSAGSVGFKCRDEVNLNQVERTLPTGKNERLPYQGSLLFSSVIQFSKAHP